jgi:hypothetical protein
VTEEGSIVAEQLLTELHFRPYEDVSKPIDGGVSSSIGGYNLSLKKYRNHYVQLRADCYYEGTCIFTIVIVCLSYFEI